MHPERIARDRGVPRLERRLVSRELAAAHRLEGDRLLQHAGRHLDLRGRRLDDARVDEVGALLARLEVDVTQVHHKGEHRVPAIVGRREGG